MRVKDKELYAKTRQMHATFCMLQPDIEKSLSEATNLEDLADTIYTLRESQKFFEWMKKEVGKTLTLAERLCCLAWVRRNVAENIKTKHCVAMPDIKQGPRIPREGSPEYEELLQFYGVPSGTPFRPHWPALRDRITEDIKAGRPVPKGIDPSAMIPSYVVKTRKKQPILDDGEASDYPTDPDLVAQALNSVNCIKSKELTDALTQLHDFADTLQRLMVAVAAPAQAQSLRDEAAEETATVAVAPGRPVFDDYDNVDKDDEESMF